MRCSAILVRHRAAGLSGPAPVHRFPMCASAKNRSVIVAQILRDRVYLEYIGDERSRKAHARVQQSIKYIGQQVPDERQD